VVDAPQGRGSWLAGYRPPDGTVEVHAAGEPETLEAFAAELEVGPPSARVEGVDGFESDGSLPTGFEII